jgi:cytochrome c oxidase subunit 1
MFMSLVMFGFIGGISGVVLGTEQLNVLMHNTIYVPGHFHGTVVAGTTLAFMAMTYLVLPLIFEREIIWPKLAKWQPYLFGIGAGGISLFMMGAGTLGVPRRHWDIGLTDAVHAFEFPAAADLMMGLNGIFALLAGVGGAIYILVTVGTVLFGKRLDTAETQPMAFPLHSGGVVIWQPRHGQAAGHDHPGRHLLRLLRALLLRQLEVPQRSLAVPLRPGKEEPCSPPPA